MSEYEDLASLVTFRPLDRPILAVGGTRRSPFSASWSQTVRLLARELRMLAPKTTILELDMRPQDFRQDGLPRADRNARTPAIVLTMVKPRHHDHLRYEVIEFDRWQDNVRGVALGLEALRAVDRYGVTKRGEQYAGWKALPQTATTPSADRGKALIDRLGGVTAALRATHPDNPDRANNGLSDADFKDVQAYRDLVAATA
jgi:hypothetical protein